MSTYLNQSCANTMTSPMTREACGESPELVQIVTCLPDAVEALTGDSRIKHITFVSFAIRGRPDLSAECPPLRPRRSGQSRLARRSRSRVLKPVHLYFLSWVERYSTFFKPHSEALANSSPL